jgi:hypothetical protein
MISYDQWMKDTYSLTSPRSEFLKKLDEAIKTGKKEDIKTALDRWRFDQSKQGKDWRKSVRNAKGAVTQLYRDVNTLDKRKLSDEEREAMMYIAREQAMALQKQFVGKKLTFKASTLIGMAKGAGSKWERFKAGAAGAKSAQGNISSAKSGIQEFNVIQQKVRSFCKELCPGLDPDHVFKALNLGGVESFVQTVTPFIGAISSGGQALVGWGKVAWTAYNRYRVMDSRYAFAPGDPEAAIDAVIVLIDREIASGSARAGVKTAAFTGKLLGTFADGGAVSGPVIGLIELLAEVLQAVVEYVIEYKECTAGNEMLKIGALNLELFEVCPILGCYFLVMQDHSTIINFAVGQYGTPNWMFDVEKLVAKIQKALEKARQYITLARYEIAGWNTSKGVVAADWKHKDGLSKASGAKEELQHKLLGRIDAWFDKPMKLPKVDKSRIVGFGSN